MIREPTGVAFRAYDGSTAGPSDARAIVEIRRPEAIAYLAMAPNEVGLARAYVTGALELHGEPHAAVRALVDDLKPIPPRDLIQIVRSLGRAALRRPPIPPEESRPRSRRGPRPPKQRSAAAISHHYDVSNHFYELVLGPSMAYTCAVFPSSEATLEEAQAEKFELV